MSTLFKDFGLSEITLAAVESLGFTVPTPVQEQAIPLALAGRDVVAAAKTGTGKTAAFALPLIERIERTSRTKRPHALVVTPTRELAMQIDNAVCALATGSNKRILAVVGGTSYRSQISKLKNGVDILIATPGRLYDLMQQGAVNLEDVEVLVLDEADRMLDMGFWPTMKKVVAATPPNRQTLLFSATIDRAVMGSVATILHEPAFVEIALRGETADTVDQFIIPVIQTGKPALLRTVLEDKGAERVIVFARTKQRAEACAHRLHQAGYRVDSIHSDKSQPQRKRALDGFAKGTSGVIIATDVLSRGIDVSDVDYVINYDLPDNPEDYVHRIGRTGRAGAAGYALSFVSPEEKAALLAIEKLIGSKIPTFNVAGYDNTAAAEALANQLVTQPKMRSASDFSRSLRTHHGGFGRRR